MASEIRVNKIANRAGLSTVEYTDTGIIVSGVVTCTEISGLNALNIAGVSTFATTLDINGDIDVDGHTNLDNLSVAGVTTFGGSVNYPVGAVANFFEDVNFKGPSGRDIVFDKSHAELHFSDNTSIIMGTNDDLFVTHDGTNPSILTKFGTLDIKTSQVAISTNMTVGGILTATTFKGDGSQLTGIVAGLSTISGVVNVANDLDVDGHTNLDNVSIAGVTTFSEGFHVPVSKFVELKNSSGATRFYFRHHTDNITSFHHDGTGRLEFLNSQNGADIQFRVRYGISNTRGLDIHGTTGNILPYADSVQDIGENTKRWRNGYFDTLYGDGANLSNLPAGAPVGGASTNTVFFENDTAVAVNYQVTSGKNAMSAGPIAINAGIAVTVPSGSSWTIV